MRSKLRIVALLISWVGLNATAQTVVPQTCEWWLDSDFDGRQQVALPANGEWQTQVDGTGLFEGVHSISLRTSDSKGRWGSPVMHYFVCVSPSLSGNGLSQAEYWINGDFSKRCTASLATDGTLTMTLDVADLPQGVHSLSYRVGDSGQRWSGTLTHYFTRMGDRLGGNALKGLRYWIDDNDGNAAEASLSGGVANLELDLGALPAGVHSLSLQPYDGNVGAGSPLVKYFIVPSPSLSGNGIVAYEYWFNNGPRTRVSLDPQNPAEMTEQWIEIENVRPNEIPADYTLDLSTRTVWCDDSVHMGLQAIDAMGNASLAVLSDTFAMRVPVPLDIIALTDGTPYGCTAPEAGELCAFSADAYGADSVRWSVTSGCTLDLYDATGSRLSADRLAEDENGYDIYGMKAVTSVVYAIVHHAPAVLKEMQIRYDADNPSGVSNVCDGFAYTAGKHWLRLTLPNAAALRIWNTGGQLVVDEAAEAGTHLYELAAGVYVIDVDGKDAHKVMIP